MCAAVARARSFEYDEPDKIVVDVEEDDVQVRLQDPDGVLRWHRRANIEPNDHTGCGRRYDFRFEQLGQRMSRLDEGELCKDGCYTPFELERAQELRSAALARRRSE